MNNTQQSNGSERSFDASERLISTTDLRGNITQVNKNFADIAGFTQEELLGKAHNIVRHPDMPKAAFGELWEHLKQGKPWMGMVKNRCKSGDYYWVNAYVTPTMENGQVIGYQSVRIKPDAKIKEAASDLYAKVNGQKASFSLPKLSMHNLLSLGFLVCMLPFALSAYFADLLNGALLGGAAASLVLAYLGAGLFAQPYRKAADATRTRFNSAIARQVYTGRDDELGQLQLTIKALESEIITILTRVEDSASRVGEVANDTSISVNQTNQSVETQRIELDNVCTAMHEMTTTVEEVARNTAQTADAAQEADDQVMAGRGVVEKTVNSIEKLAEQVTESAQVITRLRSDSESIGSVMDVIRGIADQTNLLALNAAIEAARAGEQGRGFAVVADEVRTLASQTRNSTEQIQGMIESLQTSTGQAVSAMESGSVQAESSVEQAKLADAALNSIGTAVTTIKDMSMQIATASEEQSSVAEEINRNINTISDVANLTAEASEKTARSTENLVQQVGEMHSLVNQF